MLARLVLLGRARRPLAWVRVDGFMLCASYTRYAQSNIYSFFSCFDCVNNVTNVRMNDTTPEAAPSLGLKRTQLMLPEDLLDQAKGPMRERYARNLSDYVTRLIQEDVQKRAEQKQTPPLSTGNRCSE
jgi:hypothetical protein